MFSLARSFGFSCLVLFASVAHAQIELSYTKAKSLAGVTDPRQIGDQFLVGADSQPTISNVAIIKATTPAKFLKLRARTSLFQTVELEKISNTEWLLSQPGKYAVEATSFDPDKGIDEKTIEVVLDGSPSPPAPGPTPPGPGPGPEPTPPPGPTPGPVPVDEFDNIGQRVASWSVGLPKKAQVSACYVRAATRLFEDPTATINSVSADLVNCRTSLLGNDASLYIALTDKLNADLKARWPMSKGTLADYFVAISKGLQ
jgi:hypothetical protein